MGMTYSISTAVTKDLFVEFRDKTEALHKPVLLSMLREGKVELTDIKKDYWDDDMILAYLTFNPDFISALDNPTEEMYIKAVEFGDTNLINKIQIKNRTEKVYMMAVTKHPHILASMPYHDQTEKICLCAIAMDPTMIRYVECPTQHMYLAVVRRNGLLLEHCKYPAPSDEVIRDAIKENGEAIKFVPKDRWTYSLFIDAVASDPFSIRHFYDYTECLDEDRESMDFLIKSAIWLNPYVINCDFFALPEYSRYAKCAIMTDPFVYRDMQPYLRNEENDKLAVKLDARLLSDVSKYTMDTIIEAFRTNSDIAWHCWARQAYPIEFFFARLYVKLEFLHKFTHTIEYKE